MLSDNSQSKEDEEMLVDDTGQQSASAQGTSDGAALTDKDCKDGDKDLKDDINVENPIEVVEPVSKQGMGQSIEIIVAELPVSCTSPADELVIPIFVQPSIWYLHTVPDLPILPFPPILAGPGEVPQVYNNCHSVGCSVVTL